MRIKIIGDNNCARATRHLLRLGGFAVTEYLPADALAGGPLAGYAITIDLAPATHSPDAHLRPDSPTLHAESSTREEATRDDRDASSPAFAEAHAPANKLQCEEISGRASLQGCGANAGDNRAPGDLALPAPASNLHGARIHFDSVESELEAAVLRHVTQLAVAPVIVDRPGGVVHSDRELRIVLPNSGDGAADDAAAVAVEFGVLRGLLDLTAGSSARAGRGKRGGSPLNGEPDDHHDDSTPSGGRGGLKRWWPFGIVLILVGFGVLRTSSSRVLRHLPDFEKSHRLKSVLLEAGLFSLAQGQFDTGQGFKISDGNNFLVVDPCSGQMKLYASITQTGNTQLVSGTVSKKIYVCSVQLVAAAATNVALVEGTGSVCGTGTAGVNGFGGATAATGWNFAANGGIAQGNGASSLGAEGNSGDNLCLFNSGSGQVSGGISYVVQ